MNKDMSEVTLEAITDVIRNELEPINTKLNAIGETVSSHTGALVEIAKDVKDIKAEMLVNTRKFEKHEKAIKLVAEKVGVVEQVSQIVQG